MEEVEAALWVVVDGSYVAVFIVGCPGVMKISECL